MTIASDVVHSILALHQIFPYHHPMKHEMLQGVVHTVPLDLQEVLIADPVLLSTWNSLTALARNEWICWLTIVKKPETRIEHLIRLQQELKAGKRRPCCWPGCPHRNEKAKKWFK